MIDSDLIRFRREISQFNTCYPVYRTHHGWLNISKGVRYFSHQVGDWLISEVGYNLKTLCLEHQQIELIAEVGKGSTIIKALNSEGLLYKNHLLISRPFGVWKFEVHCSILKLGCEYS